MTTMPLEPDTLKTAKVGQQGLTQPSHRPVRLQLAADATFVMVPRAPLKVASPPVFRPI
jgi:hypothetical protein